MTLRQFRQFFFIIGITMMLTVYLFDSGHLSFIDLPTSITERSEYVFWIGLTLMVSSQFRDEWKIHIAMFCFIFAPRMHDTVSYLVLVIVGSGCFLTSIIMNWNRDWSSEHRGQTPLGYPEGVRFFLMPWILMKFETRKANDTEPYFAVRWAFVCLQRNEEIRKIQGISWIDSLLPGNLHSSPLPIYQPPASLLLQPLRAHA